MYPLLPTDNIENMELQVQTLLTLVLDKIISVFLL